MPVIDRPTSQRSPVRLARTDTKCDSPSTPPQSLSSCSSPGGLLSWSSWSRFKVGCDLTDIARDIRRSALALKDKEQLLDQIEAIEDRIDTGATLNLYAWLRSNRAVRDMLRAGVTPDNARLIERELRRVESRLVEPDGRVGWRVCPPTLTNRAIQLRSRNILRSLRSNREKPPHQSEARLHRPRLGRHSSFHVLPWLGTRRLGWRHKSEWSDQDAACLR